MKTAVDWGIPHPWEEKVVPESGRVYYWNHEEGVPSWTHPLQEDFAAVADVWHRVLKICNRYEQSGLDVDDAKADAVEVILEQIESEMKEFDEVVRAEVAKWRTTPVPTRAGEPNGATFFFRQIKDKKGKTKVLRQWTDPRKSFDDRRRCRSALMQRILEEEYFPFHPEHVREFLTKVKYRYLWKTKILDVLPRSFFYVRRFLFLVLRIVF